MSTVPDVCSRTLRNTREHRYQCKFEKLRPSSRADKVQQWGNRTGDKGRVRAKTKVSTRQKPVSGLQKAIDVIQKKAESTV